MRLTIFGRNSTGVLSSRSSRIDRLRNMATKSSGHTTMRTLTTLLIAILCAVQAHAQKKQSQEPPQPQQDDEKILNIASNARDQVDSFVEAWGTMLLMDSAKNRVLSASLFGVSGVRRYLRPEA